MLKAASQQYAKISDISESDDEADQSSKLAAVALIENEKRRQHMEKMRKKAKANKQYGHLLACQYKYKKLKCNTRLRIRLSTLQSSSHSKEGPVPSRSCVGGCTEAGENHRE